MDISGSQVKLWNVEQIGDDFESEELYFQVQTKEEIQNNLLYFRTCMKLELDKKISECDITCWLEKKVPVLIQFIFMLTL